MAFTFFFRDLQTLVQMCDSALPEMISKSRIKIWDAGCAMGQEPYTLAMLIRERIGIMGFRNVQIKATDIDNSDLFEKLIKEGIYPREQIERIPTDILGKYFSKITEEQYQLNPEIRKAVNFTKHDLTSLKPVDTGFNMIICKNVLLHFDEQERINVIKMFHASLDSGGYFATEQTQKLPNEVKGLFEQVVPNAQLFRKITNK